MKVSLKLYLCAKHLEQLCEEYGIDREYFSDEKPYPDASVIKMDVGADIICKLPKICSIIECGEDAIMSTSIWTRLTDRMLI